MTLQPLDSLTTRKKKHRCRKRRLFRITDRVTRLMQGQKCFSETTFLARDSRQRFHCTTGPAIKWEDGEKAYFLEGVRFDYDIWKQLVDNTLPARAAIKLFNLAQRRYAIKRIGYAEAVKELGFRVVQQEGDYKILEGQLDDDGGRICRILQVKCPSTGYDYFLRVPPWGLTSIKEALAWTFGMDTGAYRPEVET